MPIKFFCYSCGKKVKVPDGVASREGSCPRCKAKLTVPESSVPAPPGLPSARLPENAPTDYESMLIDLGEAPSSAAPSTSAAPLPVPDAGQTLDEHGRHSAAAIPPESRWSPNYNAGAAGWGLGSSTNKTASHDRSVGRSHRLPQRARKQARSSEDGGGFNFLQLLSALTLVGGLVWGVRAYTMDTSLPVGSEYSLTRVHNIGLMQERELGTVIGGGMAAVGLLGLILSSRRRP